MAAKYVYTKNGQRRLRKSTAGWKLLEVWKNGEEQWMSLSTMKRSNLREVTEFVTANGIEDEPAFYWWIPFTLRQRDRTIAAVSARTKRVTHKYGVEIPFTIEEAYVLDKKNGDTQWHDAVNKKMGNLIVDFDSMEDNKPMPVKYTLASGHLVFDVRMTLE